MISYTNISLVFEFSSVVLYFEINKKFPSLEIVRLSILASKFRMLSFLLTILKNINSAVYIFLNFCFVI